MVINKLRQALAAGQQAVADPDPEARTERVAWGFIHLDDMDIADEGLREHQQFCQQSGYRCLVIANRFPPVLLERPEVIYEFVPLDVRSAFEGRVWPELAQRYTVMRLLHIVEYWRIIGCNWTGSRSGDLRRHAATMITGPSVLTVNPEK